MSFPLFERSLRYAGFSDADQTLLREAHPIIRGRFTAIVESFYARAQADEVTHRVFTSAEMIQRLKQSFHEWLEEIFIAPRDEQYCERRLAIGAVHLQIGLLPAFVFSAMAQVRADLEVALEATLSADRARLCATRIALHRALDIDLGIISGAYHEAEKYHDLVDSAPEMIHSLDRDGRILEINRFEVERLGLSRANLVGRPFSDLVHPEDRAAFQSHLNNVLEHGSCQVEVRLQPHPESVLDVEIHSSALKDPVTLVNIRVRAYLRDVTERKRMHREMMEKQSLVRLGEMAAVVAHEVKNPLAGISGALSVLAGNFPEASTDAEIIREILARLDALNSTVNDLLLYARPRMPRPELIDLKRLLESTVDLARRDNTFAQVDVSYSGEAATALGDPQLLKPVFLNLLMNAAQAQRGVGRIDIRFAGSESSATVEIADAGPGIPPEVRSRVFEPFFTTKNRGTGLGLSIAQRIVHLHGGSITLDGPPTGGTIVRVTLPSARPAEYASTSSTF